MKKERIMIQIIEKIHAETIPETDTVEDRHKDQAAHQRDSIERIIDIMTENTNREESIRGHHIPVIVEKANTGDTEMILRREITESIKDENNQVFCKYL